MGQRREEIVPEINFNIKLNPTIKAKVEREMEGEVGRESKK